MSISELLLPEFDIEMQKTRTTLERVPADKPEYAPHPKSMILGRLAPHIAQLPDFGLVILTTPELDFAARSFTPIQMESAAQLVQVLDEGAAKVRSALAETADPSWTQRWRLAWQGKSIFEGSRFMAYRQMFMNHLTHHRAQLGVYLP
jgi:uncharacterized damage-inducible protein DinB